MDETLGQVIRRCWPTLKTKSEIAVAALIIRYKLIEMKSTAPLIARIVINEMMAAMARDKMTIEEVRDYREDIPAAIVEIAFLQAEGLIEYRHVKKLFEACWRTPYWTVMDEIIEAGMLDELDESDLLVVVRRVIEANPKVIETVRKGKVAAAGALIGQVMKQAKADPKMIKSLIDQELGLS
jgi:Asp-tRNA(Asn)/Glu-tRNA(Gln) amidotransferase B subunit